MPTALDTSSGSADINSSAMSSALYFHLKSKVDAANRVSAMRYLAPKGGILAVFISRKYPRTCCNTCNC